MPTGNRPGAGATAGLCAESVHYRTDGCQIGGCGPPGQDPPPGGGASASSGGASGSA